MFDEYDGYVWWEQDLTYDPSPPAMTQIEALQAVGQLFVMVGEQMAEALRPVAKAMGIVVVAYQNQYKETTKAIESLSGIKPPPSTTGPRVTAFAKRGRTR